ncbi:hypothetical protein KK120_08850 [Virgibacillus dakarensis]|nr:hypothetical protein [Virgibacillus dakarensis]MBT2215930.1 hypothetical protein [Virgibacillus dakarensis]
MTNADRLSKAIMALGEFDHEEFSDLKAEYAIKFVDEYAEWLIQQAERAEILKQRNICVNRVFGNRCMKRRQKLKR